MYTCCCCCGQQRLTHCDSMDCSPPGSSVHRICQALGDYAMAIHSSILVWRIPWTEEPGGLQSMWSQRVRHGWATSTTPLLLGKYWVSLVGQGVICLQCRKHRFNPCVGKIPWRREWPLTPVFLPREFHRQRSLVSYSLWGCRVGHYWGTNTFTFIR